VGPAITAPARGALETSTARVLRSLGLRAWMENRAWHVRARARRSGPRSIAAKARLGRPTLASLRRIRRFSRTLAHAPTATRTMTRPALLHALLLRITRSLFALPLKITPGNFSFAFHFNTQKANFVFHI